MSRIEAIRWLPNPSSLNITTTNSSHASLAWPPATQEWIQMDLAITLFVITIVFSHAYISRFKKLGLSGVFTLFCVSTTLLLAPIVASVLLLFSIYRYTVSLLLKFLLGQRFAGLLHGTDTFWALEDDTSLSIINVLALADFSFIVSASTQDDEPLRTISELIQDRLLTSPLPFPKLMWSRHQSRLGYFYWLKHNTIDISTHIRWMNIEDNGEQAITEPALKNFVSSVTNLELPSDHKAGWEILVGRHPIKPSSDLLDVMESGSLVTKSCAGARYPVLFRIHHSIGDGVALVNLLLDSLSDPYTRCNTPDPHGNSPSFVLNFEKLKTPTIYGDPEEVQVVSPWEKPGFKQCTNTQFCDLMTLNMPCMHSNLFPRNSTMGINHYPLQKSGVKVAWEKLVSLIYENKNYYLKNSSRITRNFNIIVNDRPSVEFLDFMHNATNNEKTEYLTHSIYIGKYAVQLLKTIKHLFYELVKFSASFIQTAAIIIRQWTVLLYAPTSIITTVLTQVVDDNLLHGPKLSGYKVIAWNFEQQDSSDQLLMTMIRRIRSKMGVRFSDVLLTAVSSSLETFYSQSKEVPKYINVVIPARICERYDTTDNTKKGFDEVSITGNDKSCNLENKFSVAMLLLPIATKGSKDTALFRKLREVQAHCDQLRSSPDYQVNYWLLRVVATLLPCSLLRPLLRSTHSTLVLSNLPGPTRLTKLAGHTLHDLVFWVPNRTTTGVGLTALSYAGRLQLGLMVDRALVPCQLDAQLILDGVASAIKRMDHLLFPPELSIPHST